MKSLLKGLEVKAGFWSLFDQGTVSLGNFLTQLLLARNLGWNDYGVFALVYGVLFFLVNSLGTFVTYPLSIKGASVDRGALSRLSGASLWLGGGLLLPEALIVLCAVAVLRRVELLLPAVLALIFWQFQETLRRALMARLGHRDAAWGDGLSYLGQAAAVLVMARNGDLTLASSLLAIAATSAVAATLQFIQVRPRSVPVAELRTLAVVYWRLGRWASSTNLVSGATQQAFPWVLGLLFGTAETGSFQAVVNPLKVFNPVIASAQNFIVPAAARAQRANGFRAASRRGLSYAAAGSAVFLPYLVVVLVWPHAVLGLLYGWGSPYSQLGLGLRICAIGYSFGYWAEVIGSLLNGLGLPQSSFLAQLGGTAASVCVGVPLTVKGGLLGALGGVAVCAVVKAGISLHAVKARSGGVPLDAAAERASG